MALTFGLSVLLWALVGVLVLLPHADEHSCVWCFFLSVAVCVVLGPLVWVALILMIAARIIWQRLSDDRS